MKQRRGTTCQVSAFEIDPPPDGGVFGPHPWIAVATAHASKIVKDAASIQHVQISMRASALTEAGAMEEALRALLAQLDAQAETGRIHRAGE